MVYYYVFHIFSMSISEQMNIGEKAYIKCIFNEIPGENLYFLDKYTEEGDKIK